MTKEEIKRLIDQRPFRPFKLRVAGDGEYVVPSLDHVSLHPGGRLLFVHLDKHGSAIIDVPLITSAHIEETV